MSYILDALRRADAERERGTVPGLNAQPIAPAPAQAANLRVPLLAGAALGLLALAGVLAWAAFGARREAPPPAVLASAGPAVPAVVVAPAPAAVVAPAAPAPVVAASVAGPPPRAVPPARAANPATAPVPVPAPRPVTPAGSAAEVAAPPPGGRVPTPRTPGRSTALSIEAPDVAARAASAPDPAMTVPATRTAPAPVTRQASSAAAGDAVVVTLAQLPDSVRRELPSLSFGGAMYSPTPASRMLVVNGQLQREGDQLGPELWLERIQLKDAVLRYKGHRFSVSY